MSSLAGMASRIEEGEESVKVGAIYPLSGSLAATGADVKNGVLFAADIINNVWSRDLVGTKPLVGTVNQMFKERYGTDMDGNSARAFTGMMVLAEAINRAGSSNPKAIRNALPDTNVPADVLIMPWDGVRFDPKTHQNIRGNGIICQIIDQDYYTVWPWNLATKELIWPMPTWGE